MMVVVVAASAAAAEMVPLGWSASLHYRSGAKSHGQMCVRVCLCVRARSLSSTIYV